MGETHVKAVFLDRDGVICCNRHDHIKSWDEFQFLRHSREAISRLTDAGLQVVVVTNQSVIHRGLTPVSVVEDIHQRMKSEVEAYGGRIARVYYCPHRPEENCDCRKPRSGMLLQAAEELGISLEASYLIGDAITDVQAAQAVGVKAYMVLTGRGRHQYQSALHQEINGFNVALDLWWAVDDILRLESLPAAQSRQVVPNVG
jgi:D-glycero-D-manno-heptose 1,7-bisphosphate phosphatase